MATTGGWQTGAIRIELNTEGVRELLRSEPVALDIERRADAVAVAANGRYDAIEVGARDVKGAKAPIVAVVHMGLGKNRARGRVVAEHPAALNVESRHRVLGASMDAARS